MARPPPTSTSLHGFPVTTELRTAYDLGGVADRTEAVVALDAMCARRLVTVPRLLLKAAGLPPVVAQHEVRDGGWAVLVFTADDVLRRPALVARQVAALIADRR